MASSTLSESLVQINCAQNTTGNSKGQVPDRNNSTGESRHHSNSHARASSYIIYVDLPDNSNEMLLIHGYTGAYDRVSRDVASYIRSLELRRAPAPLYGTWTPDSELDYVPRVPSDETQQLLRSRGYLTTMTFDEEEAFFCKLVAKIHEKRLQHMPSYIFMPTYNCNLRCSYCFQDHMRTDARFHHLLRTMSFEVVDRIFVAMKEIEPMHGVPSDSTTERSIRFFGGEPLLADSRPVVEYIMRKAFTTGAARFSATSNATELEAYSDLLGSDKIAHIQVTLDGPPPIHDQRRIYPNGTGSFARIASNITMALDRGVFISVRMNVDRGNLAQLPELAEVIHSQGWDKYQNFSAYTAPIRALNGNVQRSDTLSTAELSDEQAKLTLALPILSLVSTPDVGIKQDARRIFDGTDGATPILHESFCGSHTGMYIFDAFGDIYTCWDKTGDPSIRVGRIDEQGHASFDSSQIHLWHTRTVASNPVCRKCRYALHCGGGCAVLAYKSSGGYHRNFCDGFAASFRRSVAQAYLEHNARVPSNTKAAAICRE